MTSVPITEKLPADRENPFAPPPELRELRAHAPISRLRFMDGHLGWLVTGHRQARELLGSPHFSNLPEKHHPVDVHAEVVPPEQRKAEPGMFIVMDPPDHTRLRKLLQRQFTVRRMNQLAEWIAQIVDERLNAMRELGGRADLVREFALPVPSLVICALLGVPYDQRDRFQSDTQKMFDLTSDPVEAIQAHQRNQAFLRELVAARKAAPGDDMVSDLVATGELTDEETANIALLLLLAGYETTANMLGIGTFALLQHPEQLAILKNEPAVIGNAVEELMRYVPVTPGSVRTALVDVAIDGHLIEAGDSVLVHVAAVNRDPARFDDPESLDVRRSGSGHLSFSYGIHQCLGQQLARLEMRIAFAALFRAFPDLRLDVAPEDVPLRTNMVIYGVHSLPVAW